jgi:hypothetical protein
MRNNTSVYLCKWGPIDMVWDLHHLLLTFQASAAPTAFACIGRATATAAGLPSWQLQERSQTFHSYMKEPIASLRGISKALFTEFEYSL